MQDENVVLCRLGRVKEARPGLTWIIPLVIACRVSPRIITMPIQSQGIITRDNVGVDISAVAYFRVVNAVKSVVAIENVHADAPLAIGHELLICHGDGPQVGMLSLESETDPALTRPYPLADLLAETQGMIGYWLTRALAQRRNVHTDPERGDPNPARPRRFRLRHPDQIREPRLHPQARNGIGLPARLGHRHRR